MDFNRAVALAQKLIEKNGRSVLIQRLRATAIDADKPWKGAGTPTVDTSTPTKGVFLPHTGTIDLGLTLTDKELSKKAEQVVMVAGISGKDLSTYHQIVDGGQRWRMEWIRVLKPADIAVLYVFGVSR